nr:hypothetical protein GCM10020093_091730 [Planobispora longispora]
MISWAAGAFIGSIFGGTMMNRLGRHLLHIGLTVMTAGLVGLYLVFSTAGTDLGGWDLTAPMVAFGIGMGMIFVPLFDIILADLGDREIGSASGLVSSFEQLGASLGVAVLGTVFFSTVGHRPHVHGFLDAAGLVTLLTIGLTSATFVIGFMLPKKAREGASAH